MVHGTLGHRSPILNIEPAKALQSISTIDSFDAKWLTRKNYKPRYGATEDA